MWICNADRSCNNKGVFAASASKQARVATTLKLIDYYLLNWQALGIDQHGLRLFNDNDIRTLLSKLAGSHRLTTSIYQWPQRLTAFLQAQLDLSEEQAIAQTLDRFPFLKELPPRVDDDERWDLIDHSLVELGQWTEDQIVKLRVVLWRHGWYRRNGSTDFRWSLNTEKIINYLYAGRTLGHIKCPAPQSLSLVPIERRHREYPAAATRHQHQSTSLAKLGHIISVLGDLDGLSAFSCSCPLSSLSKISRACLMDQFKVGSSSRFISVPTHVVLSAIRHAIEFYLEYGQAVISSYLALALAARQANETVLAYSSRQSIKRFLAPALEKLQVQQWCLNTTRDKFSVERTSRHDFYNRFRRSPGLWELLRVLFGGIALALGALQARRSSELQNAMADTCLTVDQQSFVTLNRKTGLMDLNQTIVRPLPAVVSQMLVTLQDFQSSLIQLGLLEKPVEILSYPSIFGPLRKLTHAAMNESMDFFCDFFQIPTNSCGQRYYFRQHQLRRFFAQLFFWYHDNDSLDVLRWMLGHSDTQMIYHYISDTTPGEVLRQVKAEWGTHMLKKDAEEVADLRRFLHRQYGTLDFALLSQEALEGYIEQSLAHRDVSIEPLFIHDDAAISYKIIVCVHPRSTS